MEEYFYSVFIETTCSSVLLHLGRACWGQRSTIDWRIISSSIAVSRREWKSLLVIFVVIICMNYIVFIASCRQLSTYWIDDQTINSEQV